MNICVYCSSSDAVAPVYVETAAGLGTLMARRSHALVYGGASVGLMGAVARAVRAGGGSVVSVMPEAVRNAGITFEDADEIIYTGTLRERKAVMEERADSFIALPGGFGTLEETIEILTLKQLKLHAKPIAFINTNGFYDPLIVLFEKMYAEKFAKGVSRGLYAITDGAAGALDYIESYRPAEIESKWFR
jgi:cytokinin riboside 5'-monophosphate phosphoribohydrolase